MLCLQVAMHNAINSAFNGMCSSAYTKKQGRDVSRKDGIKFERD